MNIVCCVLCVKSEVSHKARMVPGTTPYPLIIIFFFVGSIAPGKIVVVICRLFRDKPIAFMNRRDGLLSMYVRRNILQRI